MKLISKLTVILVLLAVFASSATAESNVIKEFTATNQGLSVLLEWSANLENGVVSYNVQRSFDGRQFFEVASIEPEGLSGSYSHIDEDLYKETLNTYYYRIEVRMITGTPELSETEEVILSFSGIRRTWGSIKALFR